MSRSRKVVRLALAVVTVLALGASCGGGSSSSSTSTTSTTAPWSDRSGTWTFLVYLDADNNLESSALADLRQMARTTTTKVVVLVDRATGRSGADVLGLGNFTDAALLLLQDGAMTVLQTPGEIDMGSSDTLASFVAYGLENHRSAKNALVLWDHGGSWKGVAWDDSSADPADPRQADHLTLDEVATGTRQGLAEAGVTRLDLFGFDACLMATYEVAVAVAPYADVMVASEELEPGHGWDWTSISTAPSGATTKQMADAILQGYVAEAEDQGQNDVTLSAVDLHALPVLTAAIDLYTEALRDTDVRIGRVGYSRNQAIGFGRSPDPSTDYFSVDLGAFAVELERVDGMQGVAAALHDAVHAVVVRRADGASSQAATGLAAYFPPAQRYLDPAYERAGIAPSWTRALRAYYSAAAAVPDADLPEFTHRDRILEPDDVFSSGESLDLLTKVRSGTGGNIIAAYLDFGQIGADGDLVDVLGEVNATVAGDTVSGSYGWRRLVMSDGKNATVGFASIALDPAGRIDRITIPILLTDGSDTMQGQLVLAMDDETILAETFYAISDDAISAIEPQPGLSFFALVERYRLSTGDDEWVPATTTPLATASPSLTFEFQRLPVGTPVFAGLGIVDIRGGVDLVIHRTEAPPE